MRRATFSARSHATGSGKGNALLPGVAGRDHPHQIPEENGHDAQHGAEHEEGSDPVGPRLGRRQEVHARDCIRRSYWLSFAMASSTRWRTWSGTWSWQCLAMT